MAIIRDGKSVIRCLDNAVDKLDATELEVLGARMKAKRVSGILTEKLTILQQRTVDLNGEIADVIDEVTEMVSHEEAKKDDTAK